MSEYRFYWQIYSNVGNLINYNFHGPISADSEENAIVLARKYAEDLALKTSQNQHRWVKVVVAVEHRQEKPSKILRFSVARWQRITEFSVEKGHNKSLCEYCKHSSSGYVESEFYTGPF